MYIVVYVCFTFKAVHIELSNLWFFYFVFSKVRRTERSANEGVLRQRDQLCGRQSGSERIARSVRSTERRSGKVRSRTEGGVQLHSTESSTLRRALGSHGQAGEVPTPASSAVSRKDGHNDRVCFGLPDCSGFKAKPSGKQPNPAWKLATSR